MRQFRGLNEVGQALAAKKESAIRERAATECEHPARRIYSWVVREIANVPSSRRIHCAACCDCGKSWERAL